MTTQIKPTNISVIRIDGGTQLRNGIDDETVTAYAEAIKEGATFPPVTLFYDGFDYWLADGFHRFHAFKRAGKVSIPTEIHQGEKRDAWLFALGANDKHGKTRTNDDKRLQATAALQDEELSHWSDNQIAKQCNVSHPFVGVVRKSLTCNVSSERTYTTKHGTQAVMNTASIGSAIPEARMKEIEKEEWKRVQAEDKEESKPLPKVIQIRPEYTPEDRAADRLQEAQEAISSIAEELQAAKDGIATEGDPDAKELIAGLREEVRILNIELDAIKTQRDILQGENKELKSQCLYYAKKLKAA